MLPLSLAEATIFEAQKHLTISLNQNSSKDFVVFGLVEIGLYGKHSKNEVHGLGNTGKIEMDIVCK